MANGLSSALHRLRKELGLTLAQVADRISVAEATVQRWESGNIKAVRYDNIVKLADALDLDPAILMGWAPYPQESPEQKEKPAGQVTSRLSDTRYDELTEQDRALVDALIDRLYEQRSHKSQENDPQR